MESLFKKRFQPQTNPMVDDAVTEVGCEHLAKLRSCHDEAGACRRFVSPVLDLKCQPEEVFFEMCPVLRTLWGCQFMAAAVFVCLQPCQSVFFTKCRHGPHHVAVVLVVVVEVSIIEVDVPTIVRIVLRTRPVVRTAECAD